MADEDPQKTLSPLANLPQWSQVVAWIGLPAALCIFLVWVVTGDIKAQAKQQTQDIGAIKVTLAQQTERSWMMVGVLQRICLNTARTDADRLACVAIQPEPKK